MNIKKLNEQLIAILEVAALKPYKFTVDYGDGTPEDFIVYGMDAEDAKRDLYDEYSYLKKHDIKITNVEEVPEDHEEVEMPFTMIHKSSEEPDVSGTVRFIPAPFGYEYDCSVKEFNGRGPQWTTIRTIEGIKIWFRNVLFELGAKIVNIGNETWHIDDFAKNESLDEAEGIYSPRLISQAYKKEQEWLKENNYEIGETPDIQLFIIENNEIVGCTYVPRKDVYTYQPEENEYYLDMVRDSGDVLTDYNLEPAQKLVDRWNESRKWESLNEGKKREVLSDEEYAKFLLSYMHNDPTYEELLNMLPMINDDLYLEEIKTIKRPRLKSLYKKAVELKKQTNESLNEDGCYIITMDGEPIGPNCKTRKEAVEWAENNYSIDDERIAIEYDPEPDYDEDLDESLNESSVINNFKEIVNEIVSNFKTEGYPKSNKFLLDFIKEGISTFHYTGYKIETYTDNGEAILNLINMRPVPELSDEKQPNDEIIYQARINAQTKKVKFTDVEGSNYMFDESLKGYKEVAKIIKNDKGYNVAEKDEPMLVEDKSSLKSLLTELAKYL